MGSRVNWSRKANRNRRRRPGVEDIKGKMPLVAEPPKSLAVNWARPNFVNKQRPHSLLGARAKPPKTSSAA
jgi:hypothetical protein